jgi:signal transduction histidine kinase
VAVAAGADTERLIGRTWPVADTLAGSVVEGGLPVLVDDLQNEPLSHVDLSDVAPIGAVMVLPLEGAHEVRGALVIARLRDRHEFAGADLEMATTFASHAAVALELADRRTDQQRIVLLEDRNRIARDLHDHVIQRLFAVGLTIQSVATGTRAAEAPARLDRVVSDIDETIRQTRTSIFQLRGPLGPETGTVRARLLAVVTEVSPVLGFEPQVRFSGPVEAVVPEAVVDDLVAVLREALTNTARHAGAHGTDIDLAATPARLSLEIVDNGIGIGDTERRSGLANLRGRAEAHGGSLVLGPGRTSREHPAGGGTSLRWTIPLR